MNGLDEIRHVEARDFLNKNMELEPDIKKVTVVGGGVVGCELAYSLAYEKGVEVTVVEMLPDLMSGVVHANRSMLLWMMMGKGSPSGKKADALKIPIKAYVSSKVIEFNKNQVIITANKGRKNPYEPWITLTPDNIHVPFQKKLDPNNVEEIKIDTDLVILSMGGKANSNLYFELLKEKTAKEIYCIGDAREPGRGWEAVTAANDIARFI
jgi:2-enoate reductase